MFSSIGISAVLGFVLNKYVVGLISYSTFFYIITGVNVLAILLLLFLKPRKESRTRSNTTIITSSDGSHKIDY